MFFHTFRNLHDIPGCVRPKRAETESAEHGDALAPLPGQSWTVKRDRPREGGRARPHVDSATQHARPLSRLLKRALEWYIACPRHKGKGRLSRILMRRARYTYLRSYYGPMLPFDGTDKTSIYAILGDYGDHISDHLKNLPVDDSFVDIGANIGVFSLVAARRLQRGTVYAFEPNPRTYRRLEESIAINNATNIRPLNAAVGTADGSMLLSDDRRHSGASRLMVGEAATDEDARSTIRVPVVNLATHGVAGAVEDATSVHVKIDVEGYEWHVIDALRRAPWYARVASIIVEIDHAHLQRFGSQAKAIYGALAGDGFQPAFGLNSVRHYDEIFRR